MQEEADLARANATLLALSPQLLQCVRELLRMSKKVPAQTRTGRDDARLQRARNLIAIADGQD